MPIDPKFRRECAVILYANTLGRLRSRLAAAPVSVPEYVALMANAKRLRSPEPRPAHLHHRPPPATSRVRAMLGTGRHPERK